MYPNPLHAKFEIKLPYNYGRYVEMEISDELGKIYKIEKQKLNGQSVVSVDISNLSLRQGMYFFRIKNDTRSDVIKLFVR